MFNFLAWVLGTSGQTKLVLFVYFFILNNCGKLSIIPINTYSSMASKSIYIRWIRTGSMQYWKKMFSLVLQKISTIIKIKIIKLMLNFLAWALGTSGPTKLVLFVYFFILNYRWKLSIIQCNKYLFQYGFQTDLYPLD